MRKLTIVLLSLILAFVFNNIAMAGSLYMVMKIPSYYPGPNKQLGPILIKDSPSKILGNEEFYIDLGADIAITSCQITDLNNQFDSVTSAVYNGRVTTILGNRINYSSDNVLRVDLVADIPDVDFNITAGISTPNNTSVSPVSGLIVAQVLSVPKPDDPFGILLQSGKNSSDDISQCIISLSDIENGIVSATVYKTANETPYSYTYSVIPQTFDTAKSKLNAYFLSNNNNLSNTQIYITSFVYQKNLRFLAKGQEKDTVVDNLASYIPGVLGVPSSGGGGGSSSSDSTTAAITTKTEEPVTTAIQTTESSNTVKSVFQINNNTFVYNDTVVPMDVQPYIKDDRTYIPVRYLAYSLGVPEDGVTWNGDTRQVGIVKDDTKITLAIESATMIVNDEPVKMDVAPEITNDRTFLPARWVAEALGAKVDWNDEIDSVVIEKPGI